MSRFFVKVAGIAAVLAISAVATAQNSSRDAGWEAGLDLVYQDSATLDFQGGTQVEMDDDIGLSVTFGYRFNPRLELSFALDWASTDYDASIVTQGGSATLARGSTEAFTPRLNLQFNLMDRPFTPFIMGGVGYSFIDTNIPNGRPSTGCWWDPWWGYICTTVQSTKGIDEFAYQVGVGLRWDVTDGASVRLAYERHWVDISTASGTPYVDQIKLGLAYRMGY